MMTLRQVEVIRAVMVTGTIGGAAKLLLVTKTLRLRRDRPARFSRYTPVTVFGPSARHAIAFNRGDALSVATRLPYALEQGGGWHDTWIEPAGRNLIDALTGRELPYRNILAELEEEYGLNGNGAGDRDSMD